ncbi:MAG: hypothetical protein HRT36_09105 [Alphaproteobacteria bacterium]|nr:hypothetical protein [Alphaproteobacteria bacterium]
MKCPESACGVGGERVVFKHDFALEAEMNKRIRGLECPWADDVYSGLHKSEEAKLSALVIASVNELGEKRFLAICKAGIKTKLTRSLEKVEGSEHEAAKIGDGSLGF